MRKFREFVVDVAGLLLFVVVCLSLFGVSFICFLGRVWVFVLCHVWANACTGMRATFGRVWVNFHESIAAVAVVCVVFGPMVHAAFTQLLGERG